VLIRWRHNLIAVFGPARGSNCGERNGFDPYFAQGRFARSAKMNESAVGEAVDRALELTPADENVSLRRVLAVNYPCVHPLPENVLDVAAETFEAPQAPSGIRRARAACWQSTQTPSS
jgi:hypothetical protein